MKIPFPNAFTINRLGFSPFPFSIESPPSPPGLHLLNLCPMRVLDFADLLEARAQETLLVFDVDHSSMEKLELVARKAHIPCSTHPTNAIAIQRRSLRALLDNLGHWEFHLLDLPSPPNPDVVRLSPLNHHPSQPAEIDLPSQAFPSARISVHSHDDCYQFIQTIDDDLIRDVIARAITIYAGTLLGKKAPETNDLEECPTTLVDQLRTISKSTTFLRNASSVDPAGVTMEFSATPYSFQERRDYPIAGRLRYAPATRAWSLETSEPDRNAR